MKNKSNDDFLNKKKCVFNKFFLYLLSRNILVYCVLSCLQFCYVLSNGYFQFY